MMTWPTKVPVAWALARAESLSLVKHGLKPMLRGLLTDRTSNASFRRFTFGLTLLAQLIANLSLAIGKEPSESTNVLPWERRPYDVRLLVGFDAKSFDRSDAGRLLGDVDLAARRYVGDVWSLKANIVDGISPVSITGLRRLDRTFLVNQFPGQSADLWFVVAVESRPIGFRVSVRSWQPEVELESSVVSADTIDRREIPITILRLCRDLARPIGVIEQVNDRSVRIRLRAGELVSPDASFVQLSKGDLLLPMLAFRDKNQRTEKLQTIPWTFVSVDDVDASTITATIQSGLKMALGGKKRGRIDTLVVAARPQLMSTQIQLKTQAKPHMPLVAHRIEVRTEAVIPRATDTNPPIDPSSTLLSELLTDRRGLTNVSVVPDRRMVWLFAYSGQNLLARVPFVPGMEAKTELEVFDDATRLAIEADLQMLQGEIIDAVALRNTAMATIRAAAKKDDWNTVNQKLDLLKRHRDVTAMTDRLAAIRVVGTVAAKSRKDKTGEVRIHRMCDEAMALVKTHLGEDKISVLIDEMAALQSAESGSDKALPAGR